MQIGNFEFNLYLAVAIPKGFLSKKGIGDNPKKFTGFIKRINN